MEKIRELIKSVKEINISRSKQENEMSKLSDQIIKDWFYSRAVPEIESGVKSVQVYGAPEVSSSQGDIMCINEFYESSGELRIEGQVCDGKMSEFDLAVSELSPEQKLQLVEYINGEIKGY